MGLHDRAAQAVLPPIPVLVVSGDTNSRSASVDAAQNIPGAVMRRAEELRGDWPSDRPMVIVADRIDQEAVSAIASVGANPGGLIILSADSLDTEVLRRVLTGVVGALRIREPGEKLYQLTPREREILTMTARGESLQEIGTRLSRSKATVARHRANLMTKLGIHDRVELTRFAIRAGLVTAWEEP